MSDHRRCGCNEYHRVSRRRLIQGGSALGIAALTPAWLPRIALAQSDDSSRDVIVSVFLRGGLDSLTMCVPFNEKSYYDLRPTIAIAPPDGSGSNKALALDDNFGFAPSMGSLMDAYDAGDLAIVHACGLENPTRSHFEAMHFMEVGEGNPAPSNFSGWLGRHLAATAPSSADAVLRAVGIGYGLQRTLVGAPDTLPIENLAEFGFDGNPGSLKARQRALETMYAGAGEPLENAAINTVKTIDLLEAIDFDSYRPKGGASYPGSEFGYALESTAALIKADIGVEAVAVDLGGWDTHEQQGPVGGFMASLMRDLADTLGAFHADLFASGRRDVAALVMSEFGRNAFENGSNGTDHGHASMMLVMGGAIAGGRVITEWPGLDESQLYAGQDLAITIDYRDVISEVLTKRASSPSAATLFPDQDYQPKSWGVVA